MINSIIWNYLYGKTKLQQPLTFKQLIFSSKMIFAYTLLDKGNQFSHHQLYFALELELLKTNVYGHIRL